MNKKIVIGSIITIIMLFCVSITSAVLEQQTIKIINNSNETIITEKQDDLIYPCSIIPLPKGRLFPFLCYLFMSIWCSFMSNEIDRELCMLTALDYCFGTATDKQVVLTDDYNCPCEYEVTTLNPSSRFSYLRWIICSILYIICMSSCVRLYQGGYTTELECLECLEDCASTYDLCI